MPKRTSPNGVMSPGEAARYLGISLTALRRWAAEGLVQSDRTEGGHRRYNAADIKKIKARLAGTLNRRDFAAAAGVSEETVTRLAKRGRLTQVVNPGGAVRYRRSDAVKVRTRRRGGARDDS